MYHVSVFVWSVDFLLEVIITGYGPRTYSQRYGSLEQVILANEFGAGDS